MNSRVRVQTQVLILFTATLTQLYMTKLLGYASGKTHYIMFASLISYLKKKDKPLEYGTQDLAIAIT